MAEKKNIAAKVEDLIRESVEAAGYLLWDVDYYKEGADYNLLVTIENPDREATIGLEDCEKVTRLIDPILDESDPIPQAYYLEVSSAGLERTLSRPEHLAYYKGQIVTAKLYAPLDGKKSVCGVLSSFDEESYTVGDTVLKKDAVAKITTAEE